MREMKNAPSRGNTIGGDLEAASFFDLGEAGRPRSESEI